MKNHRITDLGYTHSHNQSKQFNPNMSPGSAHHTEPAGFPYSKNSDGEAFEEIAQPMPRLPIPMSSQSPLFASSFYTSSETGSIPDVSIPGSNPEGPADRSTTYDYPRRGRGDCCCCWGRSAPPRVYNSHVSGYPTGLTLSSSQSIQPLDNTLDEPSRWFGTYGTIYTDDAAMKPGDGIRRRCSNCGSIDTVTWRRSMLSPEKLVCNRCGLYERTHGVPRPKEFPRRRRSRPPSERSSRVNPPIGVEGHFRYIGPPSNMSFASHFVDAFDTMEGTTSPQLGGTSWVTYDMSDVSPASSHTSPSHSVAEPPEMYHTDSGDYLPYLL